MGKVIAVLRWNLLLHARNGTITIILCCITFLSCFIFFSSTGDGILINEIRLRLQYSYSITYSLLTLCMIFLSCFSIRSELDARQIHTLTSLPIHRSGIWMGKFLSLTLIAFIAQAMLLGVLLFCSLLFSHKYPQKDVQEMKTFFATTRTEHFPLQKSFKERIKERISSSTKKDILQEIRREEQTIPAKGEKNWKFQLKRKSSGEFLTLKYKFYAPKKREEIKGTWIISTTDESQQFITNVRVLPYTFQTLKIPISEIPQGDKLFITFQNKHNRDIIINRHRGLRLYDQGGSLLRNIATVFAMNSLHLAATISIGLIAGIAFTFSVSAFVSTSIYIISVSSSVFIDVIREWSENINTSIWNTMAEYIIYTGLFLAQGIHPPEEIMLLFSGISLPEMYLLKSWVPSVSIYFCIASLLGIYLFTKKELDKIQA